MNFILRQHIVYTLNYFPPFTTRFIQMCRETVGSIEQLEEANNTTRIAVDDGRAADTLRDSGADDLEQ